MICSVSFTLNCFRNWFQLTFHVICVAISITLSFMSACTCKEKNLLCTLLQLTAEYLNKVPMRSYIGTQGRLSPLTPWSKFPLPFPFSLPSPSVPLPSLPLRSRPSLIAARGSGERFSSPSGPGRSPAAKRYLVNFRLKISPLVATIFRSFSEINHSVFAETWGSALIINALPQVSAKTLPLLFPWCICSIAYME